MAARAQYPCARTTLEAGGGWLLVTAGKTWFIWGLVALAVLELAVAVAGKPQATGRQLPASE